ncbi:hypothetical protein C9J21_22000 [Photobacterium phosphoreum]|uniref:hypothetical protein n=1 Tax=Photobacterium phosphoreum TaxID=659 RepID=UPI000D16F9CC|nr:hypothetical protein [Photobacterium phosphoreum]PSW23974.1 hypothetical protein C9J21_22000 [Photobacterium phosphoreum]
MFKAKNINSISYLNNENINTVTLTPIFDGKSMPDFVVISRALFNTIRHDKALMKDAAAFELNR